MGDLPWTIDFLLIVAGIALFGAGLVLLRALWQQTGRR
jgi:hypothetical protein